MILNATWLYIDIEWLYIYIDINDSRYQSFLNWNLNFNLN